MIEWPKVDVTYVVYDDMYRVETRRNDEYIGAWIKADRLIDAVKEFKGRIRKLEETE